MDTLFQHLLPSWFGIREAIVVVLVSFIVALVNLPRLLRFFLGSKRR